LKVLWFSVFKLAVSMGQTGATKLVMWPPIGEGRITTTGGSRKD